jgi:TM2 domain-containing membrane protein YozV
LFCHRCGKENPNDALFCNSCGSELNPIPNSDRYSTQYQNQQARYDSDLNYSNNYRYDSRPRDVEIKSTGLGILLSFLLPGLGHLYAGKINKGLVILIVYVIMWAASYFIIPLFVAFILWIWAMVDVYGIIKEYNDYKARTGRPPW